MTRWGTEESVESAVGFVLCDIDRDSGVAWITLNRPLKHNALSVPMRDRMTDLLAELDVDPSVCVIVIRGAGASFCSGNEINEDWGQRGDDYKRFTVTHAYRYASEMAWGRMGFSQAIGRSSKVTIAQIHGHCAAAAYFLIAAKCDIVLVSDDAKIGALEGRFLGPAGSVASLHLNRIQGTKASRLLGYTAAAVSGKEAMRFGLVSAVFSSEDLDESVASLAREIASKRERHLLYLKARIRLAESHLATNVPVISGLLASHFLRTSPDEFEFWQSVRKGGVKGALAEDKRRNKVITTSDEKGEPGDH